MSSGEVFSFAFDGIEMVKMSAGESVRLRCFIVGFTGEVGKELVKACFHSDKFSKVLLLGRRQVDLPPEMNEKCEQKVIDFENLDASKELFEGVDVGYCCLGTTRGKAGKEGFIKVDHDYTMAVAELAKGKGVSQFHYVSSQGANKNSWFLYPRIKGQVEDNLSNMGFQHLYIYRPSFLVCDREETRTGERFLLNVVVKPIAKLSPTTVATPTDLLARAIVNCTTLEGGGAQRTLNNKEIYEAGEWKSK